MNTNWIARIQHIILYLHRRSKKVRVWIIVGLFIILANVIPDKAWIALFLFVLLIFPKYLIINPKHRKAVRYLQKAIEYIRKKDYPSALHYLIEANEAYPNMVLEDLIKDFATYYKLDNYVEIDLVESEIKKTKDKKILKILSEIKKTLRYINDHTQKLQIIREKITNLEKEKQQAPEQYKDDLQGIIDRYEHIKALEEAKIEFYNDLKQELWQLHRQYLYRNKIEQERQKLSDLERQFLNDSILESLEADEKKSFVDFESSYLDALAEYSDQINSAASSDLFEEIRREFELKKNKLRED